MKPLNKIVYKKGDVIDAAMSGEYDMFMHGCNCLNIMGAAVAAQVRAKIPKLYEADQEFRISSDDRLGLFSNVTSINRTMMCNLYTQYLPATTGRQLNYGALVSALKSAVEVYCESMVLSQPINICLPRIGSGLAGGNWEIVEEILAYYEFFCKVEFHVYDFE